MCLIAKNQINFEIRIFSAFLNLKKLFDFDQNLLNVHIIKYFISKHNYNRKKT